MKKYPKIGIRPTIDGRQGGVRESLEEKTMNLAKAVAELISSNLKNGDGSPVECVIADSTIGRVAESAACAEKFEREGVGSTITVTSCWCYGAETMDMNPHYPKAVWGFNGTERPGAVYLAAVLAGHAQKGLPAFGIYGRDVQDLDDNTIPEDVSEKILRFARAAQAVATMRGKSYLSMGSVSMGIAGSIVNPDFFQEYLGMRNESIDLTEIIRRMDEGIYDHEEYAKAMAWTEKNCKTNEGEDFKNRPEKRKTREQKDADWEFIVKMTIIMRDLMTGNPKLKEMGFKEEALGHNAIAAGFQGQRQWTDFYPNGDYPEALLNTSFDWNGIREAFVVATENDACNGVAMLFGHLLTNRAQIFLEEIRINDRIGSTITVTSCWCYGAETMDMNPHYPKAVWGFNGTERPGAVYLAAVLAGHAQKGLPAFGIYGRDVQDLDDNTIPEDVSEKILRFARAAQAVATMRGKSYLSMGSVSMGIAGSIVNPDFFQEYLGMRNESIDLTEIIRRMDEGIYDHEEYAKAMAWTEKNCKTNEGEDFKNRPEKRKTREQKDADWEFIVKMTIIMRDLMTGNPKLKEMGFKEEALGHNAIAAGFQGQRQWTDFYPNGDYPEALLNTSFDWNGIREAFVVATENDACNGVAMLFGHLLTNRAQIFSDVRTYWSPEAVKRVTGKELSGLAANGIIHLINSGATTLDGSGQSLDAAGNPVMKEPWNLTDADVENCLKATTWYPADRDYFRGGGFSSNFLSKGGMPVTMMRLNLIKGLGPVLQIAEGWTVEIDPEIHQKLNMRTDPTWPTTWFVPRLCDKPAFKDVYSVMNNWGANHGAISYGHIGQDLITLASMLRIPVCMHNVEEDQMFRPAAWNAFGMDKEGSDYRACATYGPIYK